MKSSDLRKKFLNFFEERDHKIVPSSSLVPKDDPSVLLTTAGMQQFKSYYLGTANPETDFGSKNTATVQKSFRTSDIEGVGDDTHLTFFEMLGNFSFGGYWKKEAIKYAIEFLESELKIDHNRIHSTYFAGAEGIPADSVSLAELKNYFDDSKIVPQGRGDNFWGPTGDQGPCGPTVEFYVDGTEIWNVVFNEFYCKLDKTLVPIEGTGGVRGIDTGMGLERLSVVMQAKKNVFETDLFASLTKDFPPIEDRVARIILDHFRAAVFLISDGVAPSNKDRGYILRRLLRRAFMYAKINNFPAEGPKNFIIDLINLYKEQYPELESNQQRILDVIYDERKKFGASIDLGLKQFEKSYQADAQFVTGKAVFDLVTTFGFPKELVEEIAKQKNVQVDWPEFEQEFQKHQELSRSASAGMFKGGLADNSEKVVRLHTATHLMNAALRKVLGTNVWQKGSNITEERTRFDFAHGEKLKDEQKAEVEKLVNEWIARDLIVKRDTMPLAGARELDAIGVFGEKYPDTVSIYTIYDPKSDEIISREFCGGPHVEHTGVIGKFKIQKEEAVSAGVRRIKATIE
ncbi:MAG: alanine--tRNA ligase [Candidatus Doudnabacteria bacterium]|nr:alanine--tRNA ligase [Candidatus Doudnabacteria bacterium]